MHMRELLFAWYGDLYRYEGKVGIGTLLKHLVLSPGYTFTFWLRLCRFLHAARPFLLTRPLYWIARIMLRHYSYKFGIFIPWNTPIGAGLYIGHCGTIQVNPQSRIGTHCNLSQGVTLGQANRGKNQGYPVVGDGVYIGPGAKIVGAVRVGNNVAIGANCVVTHDVPDNAVIVGVPGRVISYDGAAGYVEYTDYGMNSVAESLHMLVSGE